MTDDVKGIKATRRKIGQTIILHATDRTGEVRKHRDWNSVAGPLIKKGSAGVRDQRRHQVHRNRDLKKLPRPLWTHPPLAIVGKVTNKVCPQARSPAVQAMPDTVCFSPTV